MEQNITESVEVVELSKSKTRSTASKRTPKYAKHHMAVFIERESDLGFRAYKIAIEGDSVGEPIPLHNSADLEPVAVSLATQFLEGVLR
jgi:hypothetical protein